MAAHNELGREGESAAARFLAAHDYRIIEQNWRCGHYEVDLIADYFGELVFVEVKTRASEAFLPARQRVDSEKKQHLIRAAAAYKAQHGLTGFPHRYDIITVVGAHAPFRITHHPYAFDKESATR